MPPLIPDAGLFPTLIFDPDIVGAQQLSAKLEELRFSTHVALSARDALQSVKHTHFPVVVVVADLAVEDCARFLAAVHRATPRSWLVVANACVDEVLRKLVYRLGGDALIETPVDVLRLAERIALMQVRSRPLY
jgi:DNA-binding response OmpR family regulator